MGNTPNVRFKGFTEDWEQRKLEDFGKATGGTSIESEFSEDGIYKVISIGSYSENSVYNDQGIRAIKSDKTNNRVLNRNDLTMILNDKTTSGNIIGRVLLIEESGIYVYNQRTERIEINLDEYDPVFLYEMLNAPNIREKIIKQAQGNTQIYVNWTAISLLEYMIPSKEEQVKIGEYLHSIGNLITLHQQKCDETKEFKKYMLQNMFPQKDEKVPKIRFDGFTEDWEQRKLGDLVIIERGGSPRPINKFITEDENGLNWVKIGDAPEQGNYITQTKEKIRYEGLSKTREVHPGDLILSNSMSFGRPYIMAIDGCIHDGWLLIRDNEKRFDLKYLCYMLGTDMMLSQYKQMAAGSTVNNLNKELVGNTVVKYPSLEEQSKMGDYFSIFDNLITLHQQKCNALKEFKKYMLQNMFPQKGENKCQN